ncbi:hypothetical protein GCM10028805_12220 [Spirosoma harenae]
MHYLFYALGLLLALSTNAQPTIRNQKTMTGHLPVVISDKKGFVHLTYGQDSTIYYAVTSRQSDQFNQPVAVATLPQLVTSAKRGPQIAVSERYVVITVVNRAGNLFAYSLDRQSGKWSSAISINDVPEVAKEGFQAVTSASANTFHTAWLDLREDKQNKIVIATSHDGGRTWLPNRVAYRSPSGTVCECCKVSIVAKANDIYIQFRNWLDGSRDLYLAHSVDGGATFSSVQKLGEGTWKLKACPMDGGAVVISATGQPLTVWRRENTLYTCRPNAPETSIATGRNVTIATNATQTAIAWDEAGTVWAKLNNDAPIVLGKGQLPSIALVDKSMICVWEAEGQVMITNIGKN